MLYPQVCDLVWGFEDHAYMNKQELLLQDYLLQKMLNKNKSGVQSTFVSKQIQ